MGVPGAQGVKNRTICGSLEYVSFGCQTEEDECRSREDCGGSACIKFEDAWLCADESCE